jgi:hypothetical protein
MFLTMLHMRSRSGLAPPEWGSLVGPVVVWRPGGVAVSSDDMCLFNDFLSGLLDQYGDGDIDPARDLTPAAWARAKERILENRRTMVEDDAGNPAGMGMEQYTDLHI